MLSQAGIEACGAKCLIPRASFFRAMAGQAGSWARSRSPSREEMTGLRATAEAAEALSVRALQASRGAVTASRHALRVALATPQRATERLETRELSDSSKAEVVSEAADTVAAFISAHVRAHVSHHVQSHPLLMALPASSTRPLTEAFTHQEAEGYMTTVIEQRIASVARTWRVEVTDRGRVVASVAPTDAQAEEMRALRSSVTLPQGQVSLLQARLDLYAMGGRSR